jgi:hypothetical protein
MSSRVVEFPGPELSFYSDFYLPMPAPIQSRRSFLSSPGLLLFVVTFTVQLLILTSFSKTLEFVPEGDDMKFYMDWALRIAHGQWTDHRAFYGLPGYAYLMAPIFALIRQPEACAYTIGFLQALLDAGISVLLWKISRPRLRRRMAKANSRRECPTSWGSPRHWRGPSSRPPKSSPS